MTQHSKYNKNVFLYYIYTFFKSMAFQRGIFILYLAELSFSNTQIGTLQSLLYFSTFLFEIPTGILGDKIGRKWSMLCGLILFVLYGVGMIMFDHFVFFAILFVMNGIGFSFISGSGSALLYDSLKHVGREKKYMGINSRVNMISSVILGLAILAGGYMKFHSWELVYLSYAGAMAVALVAVFFMYEQKSDYIHPPAEGEEEEHHESITKVFIKFIKDPKGKLLLLFMLAYAIYESAMTPYFIFGQKLFNSFNIPANYIGLIYSVIQFTSGLAYLLSEKISEKFNFVKLIYFIIIATIVLLVCHFINSIIAAIAIFFIFSFIPEVLYIVKDNYIQEGIPSRIRASLLSLSSFMDAIFISLVYVIFGFLIDIFTIRISLVMLALLPCISFILFIVYFAKYKPEKQENGTEKEEQQA